ncbi:prepilin-type N-terminal cleavage/methylation domain-containing protein [Ventrimonas sp. CLA-AP-H27]|uniref:Prepilin-type N-terminal cleavage/methylation domain-containing protein n=1 Tax=Ventrimonas faecis TaxID=3133170 RepID=A0ABV1HKE2_9FIRM
MKNLLKKFRENKKGFTLAELLVVVAIVGILVAISIPVFTSQLGKARKATNQANMRAAKAAAVAQYMTDGETGQKYYEYDLNNGIAKSIVKLNLTDANVKTIDEADDDKRYTEIEVSVKASTVESNNNTGVDTTKDDGSVVIYVK